ncbi:MAG: sigma-70 family RNA polymerase sigma factor, partial [Desulfobacterales bacterium]
MQGSGDLTDQEVVADVLNGNSNAFSHLVVRYQRPIFNLMFRATGSTETASDLSQDAFLKAYEKLGQYHPRKKFFSWLYTLSINLVRDHLRQHR